jgi:hypothetical protein
MRNWIAALVFSACALPWLSAFAVGQTDAPKQQLSQANLWGYSDSALCKFLQSPHYGMTGLYPRILRHLGFAIAFFLGAANLADPCQAQTTFTPLHMYYISPTGNDANAGTSPSTAWATPKHPVQCGDVIIAAAGSYGQWLFGANSWGAVSNCPSTSGGIDGKGGIYFATLLCAGPYVTSCSVNGGAYEAFRVTNSNWVVEGFTATQNSTAAGGCYIATSNTGATLHHIAFINDIAINCDYGGFGTYSWTSPGGVDQTAIVGAISYNTSPSTGGGGICGSGASIIPVEGPDTSAGTHVFVAGYFGYENINAPSGAGCNTDGEGLIFDSWACMNYTYQGVAEQNVWWHNGGPGFEVFPNCLNNGDKATVYVFNNTSYGNAQDPLHTRSSSDLLLNNVAPTAVNGSSYSVFNNIIRSTEATSGNAGLAPVYTVSFWLNNKGTSSLVSAMGNYFWQGNPGTVMTAGNPNTDVWVNGVHNTTSFPFGTNTYDPPHFANPNGLPTGAPNCNNYTNTTDCMNQGYNVAADLTPSGGALDSGYMPPGACAADPYFPVWLKGVVFLLWNGTALTENAGLITKPCNM